VTIGVLAIPTHHTRLITALDTCQVQSASQVRVSSTRGHMFGKSSVSDRGPVCRSHREQVVQGTSGLDVVPRLTSRA
jgi:hypothetical protein